MLRPASSVNQIFPSGPGLMSQGSAPLGQQRKLRLVVGVRGFEPDDVVAELLREPDVAVRAGGDVCRELALPVGYSRHVARRSITPTWSTFSSVNQRVPSGRAVMSQGWAFGVGPAYSVISPWVVILPMRFGEALGEPQVAVGADRDAVRPAAWIGEVELA